MFACTELISAKGSLTAPPLFWIFCNCPGLSVDLKRTITSENLLEFLSSRSGAILCGSANAADARVIATSRSFVRFMNATLVVINPIP